MSILRIFPPTCTNGVNSITRVRTHASICALPVFSKTARLTCLVLLYFGTWTSRRPMLGGVLLAHAGADWLKLIRQSEGGEKSIQAGQNMYVVRRLGGTS